MDRQLAAKIIVSGQAEGTMLRAALFSALLFGLSFAFAAALGAFDSSVFAEEPESLISLVLSKASVVRTEQNVLVKCEVFIDNDTGKDLTVTSNFFSVFDGLELVVTGKDGKSLVQQPYTRHQSPFTPNARTFTLRRGRTTASLLFPVDSLPKNVQVVKIRVVGTLPGSGYQRILSSETIEVDVNAVR